jgi:hypothetical protein
MPDIMEDGHFINAWREGKEVKARCRRGILKGRYVSLDSYSETWNMYIVSEPGNTNLFIFLYLEVELLMLV